MKDLTEAWRLLATQRKRVQIYYVAHTLLYAAALILGLARHYPPAIAVCAANMVLYFVFLRKQIIGYSEAVSRVRILHGLCGPLKEARFIGREGIDTARFQALELLPIRDHAKSLLVREGFSGKGFALDLKGWEISLHYPVYAKGRADYRFLNGSILTAEGAVRADEGGDWYLIRKDMVETAAQAAFAEMIGMQRCDCPIGGLAKQFDIYSRSGEGMPRRWAERLNKCVQQAGSLGAIRIVPGHAAVYLSNRFYTGRTKVKDLPEPEQLKRNPLPERDAIWELFRFWSTAG